MAFRHHAFLPRQCTLYIEDCIVPALAKLLVYKLSSEFEELPSLLGDGVYGTAALRTLYATFVQITELDKRYYAADYLSDTVGMQNEFEDCVAEADLGSLNSVYDNALSSVERQTEKEKMVAISTLLEEKGQEVVKRHLHTAEWHFFAHKEEYKENFAWLDSSVLSRALCLAAGAVCKSTGEWFARAETAMRHLLKCVMLTHGFQERATTAFNNVLKWKKPIPADKDFWANLHLITDDSYTSSADAYQKRAKGYYNVLSAVIEEDLEGEWGGYKVTEVRPSRDFLRVNDVIMGATLKDEPRSVYSRFKSVDTLLLVTVMRPSASAFTDDALPNIKPRLLETIVEVPVATSDIVEFAVVESNTRVLQNSVVFDLFLPDFPCFQWQIEEKRPPQSNMPHWHQCAELLQGNHDDIVDIICTKVDTEIVQFGGVEYVTNAINALEQLAAEVEVPMSPSEMQENRLQQQQQADDDDDLYG